MTASSSPAQSSSAQKRRKRHFLLWILLGLLLAAIVWVAISANPFAASLREIGGDTPDQIVLERSFLLAPRGFRYYTFSLPAGSSHVALVGEFTAVLEGTKAGGSSNGTESADSGIELLVLSEAAFEIWRKGGSATSIYDSGRISRTDVHAELPTGAGVYYAVFSNKLSASGGSKVSASLRLHSRSWLPDWIRRPAICVGFLRASSCPSWLS